MCIAFSRIRLTLHTIVYLKNKNKSIELLVPISFTCYHASTLGLSTWWSPTALIGKSSFKVGFPLRCIQRLSLPYLATQLCRWRDNWYTRGTSTSVLSY